MQPISRLLFLLFGLLLLLSPGACSPAQVCNNARNVSNLSVDPEGGPCSSTCDCNNQRYEGFCNQGTCVSRRRPPCATPGERDTCTLLPTPEAGLCRSGFRVCQPDYLGQLLWGDCEIEKVAESGARCKDGIDNDCDGKTDSADSDCAGTCTPGQQSICYTGDPATVNEGRCKSGLKTCQSDGTWSACLGERTPQPKDCSNGQDNDCDGNIDKDCEGSNTETPSEAPTERPSETSTERPTEGTLEARTDTSDAGPPEASGEGPLEQDPDAECRAGETRACYTGAAGTKGVGACKEGSQSCESGTWGACAQEVTPEPETCEGTDEDCDGIVDESCITTLAGSGLQGHQDGDGANAKFNAPQGIVVDAKNSVYVADSGNHRIRKVDSNGNVSTIAGSGTSGSRNGTATSAHFNSPSHLAFDSSGNLLIVDSGNHSIRKLDSNGNVTTVAGTGSAGSQDGAAQNAQFRDPQGILFDSSGNLLIVDRGNHRIRRLDTSGKVTTIAGSSAGYKDGPASNAQFRSPIGLAIDTSGAIYVADTDNHRIRKLTQVQNGTCGSQSNYTGLCVTTYVGSGQRGTTNDIAPKASFTEPKHIAFDKTGRLYVVDSEHIIRLVSPITNGICAAEINYTGLCVSTFAGNTSKGFFDGNPSNARFNDPFDLILDNNGSIYISDEGNNRIRRFIFR